MRVFIIVADSFGVGELPDAYKFKDQGSNTLKACFSSGGLFVPTMKKLGLFNIDGVDFGERENGPVGAYGRMAELSAGKDTTVGHWEIAGLVSEDPLPTYPDGFPEEIIREFERQTGRGTLCNKPYSGTEVIKDYGEEHLKTGKLIVYTSADSVFQIAAHEDVVPIEELYRYCETARKLLCGKHSVGRVIARPFTGDAKKGFVRTARRHDFSLAPPKGTLLDLLKNCGKDVISVGKIVDIFAGVGITGYVRTTSNEDGMDKAAAYLDKDFDGLCFVNLVEFDSVYGHRNDVAGYTAALNAFDKRLAEFIGKMKGGDMLIVTADHGCDPSTPSTDHSREYVPLLVYGEGVRPVDLGTLPTFSCVAKTVAEVFGLKEDFVGTSFLDKIH